jgi:hypothetical protein
MKTDVSHDVAKLSTAPLRKAGQQACCIIYDSQSLSALNRVQLPLLPRGEELQKGSGHIISPSSKVYDSVLVRTFI